MDGFCGDANAHISKARCGAPGLGAFDFFQQIVVQNVVHVDSSPKAACAAFGPLYFIVRVLGEIGCNGKGRKISDQ